MTKDTYWFPHDYDADSDPKIVGMISDFGGISYGIYWKVAAMLHREESNKIRRVRYVYTGIAEYFKLYVPDKKVGMVPDWGYIKKLIDACIKDYKLFEADEEYFWSVRVFRNIIHRSEVREQRVKAGKKSAEKRKELDDLRNSLIISKTISTSVGTPLSAVGTPLSAVGTPLSAVELEEKIFSSSFTLENTKGNVLNKDIIENTILIKMQDENLKSENDFEEEEKKIVASEKEFPTDLPKPNIEFPNPVPEKPKKAAAPKHQKAVGSIPIEQCLELYLSTPGGQASGQLLRSTRGWRDEQVLHDWLEAFNRELTSRGEIEKSLEEYTKFFVRWVKYTDKNGIDPKTIQSQTENNHEGTNQQPGKQREKTYGGIKESTAKQFFADFRKAAGRGEGDSAQ